MINSGSQLRHLIEHSFYPPKGVRGVGFSRANLFGKNFQSYHSIAESIFIVAMIETKSGYDNLEEILSIENLDAVFIGPYDLSASLGMTGDFENPKFVKIIQKIKELCLKHGIACGIHQIEPSFKELKLKIKDGYNFIAYSTDAYLLAKISENPLKSC